MLTTTVILAAIDTVKLIEAIGAVLGALGGAYGFLRWIVRPLRKAKDAVKEFYHNCNFLAKEMKSTDGTSLKSSVEGLKSSIDAILVTVVRLDQKQIAIANNSDKGIFESDVNGDTIFVNRSYCRIFGRTTDEAIGKGWKAFVHPDDRTEVVNEWYSCVKENRDFVMSYRALRPDNSSVIVDCHAYVLRNLKGQPIGYMGFVVPKKG